MNENPAGFVSPEPIMRLSTGYWDSQVLLTANRLELFDLLTEGPRSVQDISAALGTQPRHTRLLLKACVALDLLREDDNRFSNSPLSDMYLVSGKDTYMGNSIRYSDNLYTAWGELEKALRVGQPTMPAEDYLGKDPEVTRHFVYGMHNRALGIGKALVELIDLSGRRMMLDVGGGPGTYSALFTQRFPELRSRVMDLPDVVSHARDIVSSMGCEDRVETFPGDYKETSFPDGNDVVLISGVFHRESEATCRKLIEDAAGSLENNGMLVISDVFTDAGGNSPLFATMFGLNMMISAPDGGVHSDADVSDWMRDAGFTDIQLLVFPPPMPHRAVIGIKR